MATRTDDQPSDLDLLFRRPWNFVLSAPTLESLPPAERLEIAFAGRSNVGKSSLINALVNQQGLARTSNTPGRTQQLVFFEPTAVPMTLVDMPGYGYADAPKAIVDEWSALVRAYLAGRPTLKRVLLLIDSRHGIKPSDREMMDMLDRSAVIYQLVLTKIDKISRAELTKVVEHTRGEIVKRAAAFSELIETSSEKGRGIDELRAAIVSAISE